MKRYSFTILFSVFIAAAIGTYYSCGADDRMPEYKLSTVQGDAKEGEAVELSGSYGGRMYSQFLEVTADGSDYASRKSLYRENILDAHSWLDEYSDIRQMIEDHRHFMRGKAGVQGFYQDKEWLIYAQGSVKNEVPVKREVVLNVDLLELASGKVHHYETTVSGQTAYSYIYVADVQRVGNQVHLLTTQQQLLPDPRTASAITRFIGPPLEIHDYTVDATNGKLIGDRQLLVGSSNKKDIEVKLNSITDAAHSTPNDYVLLTATENKITAADTDTSSYMTETIAEHLYSYSYKTGKLTALPDSLTLGNPDSNRMYGLNGNMLSVLQREKNTVDTMRYNLETGREETKLTSVTVQQLGADTIDNALIKEDRLYILMHNKDIPMAAVLNMTNGELVYKGQVTFEGPASEADKEMKNLRLLNLNTR